MLLAQGDVRLVRAVTTPALLLLSPVDVIVFSCRGRTPQPHDSSNGDLDGDVFLVCWDEVLVGGWDREERKRRSASNNCNNSSSAAESTVVTTSAAHVRTGLVRKQWEPASTDIYGDSSHIREEVQQQQQQQPLSVSSHDIALPINMQQQQQQPKQQQLQQQQKLLLAKKRETPPVAEIREFFVRFMIYDCLGLVSDGESGRNSGCSGLYCCQCCCCCC